MTDVAVVGAGFWGVAAALALRERGHRVTVYDDLGEGASRAAAGLVQKAWYRPKTLTALRLPDWWGPQYAGAGWALLRERCGLEPVGEWFATRANPAMRWRDDLWMIRHPMVLLKQAAPVDYRHVKRVDTHPRHAKLTLTEQGVESVQVAYDWVVVAAGARTDQILPHGVRTGVARLPGRAFLTTKGPPGDEPRTWLGSPYRHLTWRPFMSGGRLGDTVERTLASAHPWRLYADATLEQLGGRDVAIHGEVYGVRPVLKKIVVAEMLPRVIVATGGHRVGLALAGGVARRIVEIVEGRIG